MFDGRVSMTEDRSLTLRTEQQNLHDLSNIKNIEFKKEQSLINLWAKNKTANIHVIRIQEEMRKRVELKKYLRKKMVKHVSNRVKDKYTEL